MTHVEKIIERLRSKNSTIALAESCTGGRLCAELTTVPGSSDVVRGGVTCYQTWTKREILDLPYVDDGNVVSEKTAFDMAVTVRSLFRDSLDLEGGPADYGVATTGYLDGDDRHAWFAIFGPPKVSGALSRRVQHVEFDPRNTRAQNREHLIDLVLHDLLAFVEREDR